MSSCTSTGAWHDSVDLWLALLILSIRVRHQIYRLKVSGSIETAFLVYDQAH